MMETARLTKAAATTRTGEESGPRLVGDPRTAAELDAIMASTVDPLNRWYRYPVARAMLPVFGRLPITPNHVTYAHIVAGLTASALVAFVHSTTALIVAFVLCEIRMILDCFDGVLARAQGTSSPFGRALDEIADSIAFITLVIAMNVRMGFTTRGSVVICLTLGFGGLCANAWDFYKRLITTALRDDKDGVLEELRQKRAVDESGKGTFLAYWGVYFDSFQVWLYDVRPADLDVVRVIRTRAATKDPALKRFASLQSLLSFDNGLVILHFGVLGACFLQSELFALGWAVFFWTATMFFARRVLRTTPSGTTKRSIPESPQQREPAR